jgi:hypothetical protein
MMKNETEAKDLADVDPRMRSMAFRSASLVLGLVVWGAAAADPAAFDLAGPKIEIEVTRGANTLPAAEVPNLAAGDRLWMKADLPEAQAAHYLMVAVFLRGSTNPPPKDWFVSCETWAGRCAHEGLTLTVPKDAQQMLLFLAPETGGDFKTLMNAVRGRPGSFVRTSQDLHQASLDRARLEAYLNAVRALGEADPGQLKDAAPLLARSLAIKVDDKCLDKLAVLQAACLQQGREALILNDGHSASLAQTLTTGLASDLALDASNTAQLKSGYYGPYIGSIFDIARIFDSFHTAQYQYIPALASARDRQLSLTLNAAPSFHDPKSVLVVALPAIDAPQLPPLHPVEPLQQYCARQESLVLPVDGAPLVFATAYAHDMRLRLAGKDGAPLELSARADPVRGGFVLDTAPLRDAVLGEEQRGTLHGYWGFESFDGPSFRLVDARRQAWTLSPGEESALIVGRQDTVHLRAASVSCVRSVALRDASGREQKVEWKAAKPDELEVRLPLQEVAAGEIGLLISQYGAQQPQRVALRAFAEAAHLESFTVHAGDSHGALSGNRLDEVEVLVLKGVEFAPGDLTTADGRDQLTLTARDPRSAAALRRDDGEHAHVTLRDGRTLDVRVAITSPRPSAQLIDKSAELAGRTHGSIRLASAEELPQDAQLTFSLRSQSPPAFTREEKVEVATADGSASTVLDVGSGALTLQNSKVAIARLDPAKALGSSAFGPLHYRLLSEGLAGDWRPLVTLVRLPQLAGIDCPQQPEAPCTLSGANLFLLDSVSNDPQFANPMPVPDGFPGRSLRVPHPRHGQLYVRLRDDPGVISALDLGVTDPPRSGAADSPPTEAPRASAPPEPTTVLTSEQPAPGGADGQPSPSGDADGASAPPY